MARQLGAANCGNICERESEALAQPTSRHGGSLYSCSRSIYFLLTQNSQALACEEWYRQATTPQQQQKQIVRVDQPSLRSSHYDDSVLLQEVGVALAQRAARNPRSAGARSQLRHHRVLVHCRPGGLAGLLQHL
jgi:hypothetical protein